jgi:hypothetical protein
MTCQDEWVEGPLRADVELQNRLLGTVFSAPTAIELSPLDTGVWPEPSGLGYPVRFVEVSWPLEYSGMRLASGEVAVLDGAGSLVATTGSTYRLKGEWRIAAAIGGQLFGKGAWIDGFNVCRGGESVIAQ